MNDFLISLQDVQNYLFKQGMNSPTNINADNNLQMFREAAADRMSKYLGYDFVSKAVNDYYYNGNDTEIIYTDHRPITSLVGITINDVEQDTTDFIISNTGWSIHKKNGIFYNGNMNVKMSYQAGYTRTTMPPIFRKCALELVSLWYKLQNREGVTSESQENGTSASFNREQEDIILRSIREYKRW